MKPALVDQRPKAHSKRQARHLCPDDIPSLLRLESRQWPSEQRAGGAQLHQRMLQWPSLSIGGFDVQTGEALASLFMRPLDPVWLGLPTSWVDLVDAPEPGADCTTLFGISFTSVDSAAADAIFRFFWPRALRGGWREIVLGSPMPALRRHLSRHPHEHVEDYAKRRVKGRPIDPQLRYYHRRGFHQLVAVKPAYFPHPESLDFGAILQGHVPLSGLQPLWRSLPHPLVESFTNLLARRLRA